MPTFPYNFPCGCSLRCIFEQPEKGQPRTNHVAVLWRKLYAFQDLFLRIWVTEKPCEISQQSKLFNRYIVFLQSQNGGFVIEWQVPLGLFWEIKQRSKVKGHSTPVFGVETSWADSTGWFEIIWVQFKILITLRMVWRVEQRHLTKAKGCWSFFLQKGNRRTKCPLSTGQLHS